MKRLVFVSVILSLFVSLGASSPASADVNNFIITSFHSDQTLTRNDRQGELRIIESINVQFNDNNHGLLRAIPEKYRKHSLQIKLNKVSSESGAPTDYTTYVSNGNKVLKIGDPNRTVTGAQQYTIDYTVKNVVGFFDGYDELYWNVNGDQWPQPALKVSATVNTPKDLKLVKNPLCYTGNRGSTEQNCSISVNDNKINVETTQALLGYQNLTYVAGFEKGYFGPSTWLETLGEYSKTIIGLAGPIIILSASGFWIWLRFGRDARSKATIVPEHQPPKNLSPIKTDGLIDFSVSGAGITATVIDLAIRGYLRIIETKKKKKLRKDDLEYSIEWVNQDTTALDENEKQLINTMFDDADNGKVLNLSQQKNKLYATLTTLQESVTNQLTNEGYFQPSAWRRIASEYRNYFLITMIVLFMIIFYSGIIALAGIFIGLCVAIVFFGKLDARTAKGVEAKRQIEGLKLYLNTAEKDRINKLQSPDADYAENKDAPVKTIELFEKLLPYAIIFGVENQWASQFSALYTAPPEWYSGGNFQAFNAAYLTNSLNQGVGPAVNIAFAPPSSSRSSGYSGGSSGGGGGGGGGGGW